MAVTPPSGSRYRPDGAADYSHRFHAGNVGDVWKHCVLSEILTRLDGDGTPVTYLDTHAGEGRYALAATGEWREGIGRLWSAPPHTTVDDAVGRYVALCRRLGAGSDWPVRYPGSPALACATLGPTATIRLWERDAVACEALRTIVGDDARVRVTCDDGLAHLDAAVRDAEPAGGTVVVLIDPPWLQKPDWIAVPDALARAVAASTRATFLLWYPVKSLTRPNAMIARLAAAGVAGTIAELVTTPLDHQRNRLNGSGLVLVRPPDGTLAAVAAAAPRVGTVCATQGRAWSLRMQSWG